jgi:hypothetical protein
VSGVTVTSSGPLFDGRAEKAIQDASDEWTKTLATLGASMVRTNLHAVLRHETPYYTTRVQAQPDPPGWKVTDQGVIYGHWLEGDGSRNRTTRFKGYTTFRRTVQQINARAVSVGQQVVARYLGRMQ